MLNPILKSFAAKVTSTESWNRPAALLLIYSKFRLKISLISELLPAFSVPMHSKLHFSSCDISNLGKVLSRCMMRLTSSFMRM